MNEEQLKVWAEEKKSVRDIATLTGNSYTSVRYWLKKYSITTDGYVKSFSWDKDLIIEAIKTAQCKSDILRNLGLNTRSGNFQTLERYTKKYDIDISHIVYENNRGNRFNRTRESDDIFKVDSPVSGKVVKDRIIKDVLKEYKCESCNNSGSWNGQKLSLQLDHINGINNDNRLENLRFLCPNCHAQTETFGAKNNKRRSNSMVECQAENLEVGGS